MWKFSVLFLITLAIFSSCEKTTDCGVQAFIDDERYEQVDSNHEIISATIDGTCMNIQLASSGCDGNSWEVNLVGLETWNYSDPVQKMIAIELINMELCDAVISKSYEFDLSDIVEEVDEINFRLKGWDQLINYQR